jgi:hypothetical protein
MPLQENLAAAAAAVAAVRGLNYQSSNRGQLLDGLPEALSDTRGKFANFLYTNTYAGMLEDAGGQEPPGLGTFVAPAAVGRRLRFGNCEARSALALIYAATHSAIRPLELYSVGEDHAFMVINRTQGRADTPAQWNADAVICDPWAEDCYAKGELNHKLTSAPLAAVVGPNPDFRQYFEFTGQAWPPAALKHYLDQAGLSDIWPG